MLKFVEKQRLIIAFNTTCIRTLEIVNRIWIYRSEHLPVAVAARDIKRAAEFAEKHQIDKSYGSYEQLAEDPQKWKLHMWELQHYSI